MRRYWIETSDVLEDQVEFRGDIFHHIFDVCRQEVGSKFEVLTEGGYAYFVEVTSVEKKRAAAKILESRIIPPLNQPWIRVVLSIPRFQVMDSVLEKLVEMGVASVHPVFSEFSFVRSPSSLSENKTQRWQKIIRSATQQCGRGEQMVLHEATRLASFMQGINRGPGFMGLFAYEGDSTLSIKEALQEMRSKTAEIPKEIWIFGYRLDVGGIFELDLIHSYS